MHFFDDNDTTFVRIWVYLSGETRRSANLLIRRSHCHFEHVYVYFDRINYFTKLKDSTERLIVR